ncbi:hypothetical protein B0H12DRAFT_1070501 [Mycena haematopus]|nr:hypothetical protein B0H12DRAFT_1070501 [Mycena haematopus]
MAVMAPIAMRMSVKITGSDRAAGEPEGTTKMRKQKEGTSVEEGRQGTTQDGENQRREARWGDVIIMMPLIDVRGAGTCRVIARWLFQNQHFCLRSAFGRGWDAFCKGSSPGNALDLKGLNAAFSPVNFDSISLLYDKVSADDSADDMSWSEWNTYRYSLNRLRTNTMGGCELGWKRPDGAPFSIDGKMWC